MDTTNTWKHGLEHMLQMYFKTYINSSPTVSVVAEVRPVVLQRKPIIGVFVLPVSNARFFI